MIGQPFLLSDGQIKREMFPYAKIECARFKGITSDEFIDQKTIEEGIAVQAESAYDFVLRHINKGASVKGIYTESRWEFPVKAIRETIRNAVVHRDYSLTGKDIKIAIYDDMVEITSPGKLKPSVDFNDMDARQSDIRNKIGTRLDLERHQVGTKLASGWDQVGVLLNFCEKPRMIQELMTKLGWRDRTKFRNKFIHPLIEENIIAMTIPGKPTSSNQQYCLTEKGRRVLIFLMRE